MLTYIIHLIYFCFIWTCVQLSSWVVLQEHRITTYISHSQNWSHFISIKVLTGAVAHPGSDKGGGWGGGKLRHPLVYHVTAQQVTHGKFKPKGDNTPLNTPLKWCNIYSQGKRLHIHQCPKTVSLSGYSIFG